MTSELYFVKSSDEEYLKDKKVFATFTKYKIKTNKDEFRQNSLMIGLLNQIYTFGDLINHIITFASNADDEIITESERKKSIYLVRILSKILYKCHFNDYIFIGYGK